MYRIRSGSPNRLRKVGGTARQPNVSGSRRPELALSASEMRAARTFYRRVLRGRPVPTLSGRPLAFLVGDTIIEVRPDLGAAAPPISITVDDPDANAQRCWDAGFTVRVGEDDTGRSPISVIDPFGRRLDLTPSISTTGTAHAADKEAS